jgi:hypothetical protein
MEPVCNTVKNTLERVTKLPPLYSASLTLHNRLRIFENKVLKRTFGPEGGKVTEEGRELQTEGLCNVISSLQSRQAKKDEVNGVCSTQGKIRNAYKIVLGKPEGKRPLGRSRRRWENNLKQDLKESSYKDIKCIQLHQNTVHYWTVVNTVVKPQVP